MLDINLRGPSRPPSQYLPPKVDWDDFHDNWDSEHRTEWVDGEIIEVSPENIRHFLVMDFLIDLLKSHVRPRRLGVVLYNNFLMRLRLRPSGRMPDIMFVATRNLGRVSRTYVDGPADLAVEIISPQSEIRDRQEKLAEYEQAGIPEYWIIDEPRHEALFYVLNNAGQYILTRPDEDGIYRSAVLPALRVRVSWLWQWPLPDLEDALADLPV